MLHNEHNSRPALKAFWNERLCIDRYTIFLGATSQLFQAAQAGPVGSEAGGGFWGLLERCNQDPLPPVLPAPLGLS